MPRLHNTLPKVFNHRIILWKWPLEETIKTFIQGFSPFCWLSFLHNPLTKDKVCIFTYVNIRLSSHIIHSPSKPFISSALPAHWGWWSLYHGASLFSLWKQTQQAPGAPVPWISQHELHSSGLYFHSSASNLRRGCRAFLPQCELTDHLKKTIRKSRFC